MQTLTRKEEQIMQAVWQIGHPCLISEILKKDVTLKRNTVAPGIITLTKKGYLKVDSIGKSMTRTGTKVPFAPYSQSGTTIRKNADTSFVPGFVFRICRHGLSVSAVEWHAPDTIPSASPILTIITP